MSTDRLAADLQPGGDPRDSGCDTLEDGSRPCALSLQPSFSVPLVTKRWGGNVPAMRTERLPLLARPSSPQLLGPWSGHRAAPDVSQEAQVLKQLVSVLPCLVSCLAGWL